MILINDVKSWTFLLDRAQHVMRTITREAIEQGSDVGFEEMKKVLLDPSSYVMDNYPKLSGVIKMILDLSDEC